MFVSDWRRFLCLFLAMCLLNVPPVAASEKEPTAADIDRLIKQLGSDKFSERESASKQLATIGEPTLEPLRKAAGSADVEVRRRVRELIKTIELPPFVVRGESAIFGMDLSPDGTRLLTIEQKRGVGLWDAQTNQPLRFFGLLSNCVRFSPDGTQMLSGSGHYLGDDFTLRWWGIADNRPLKELRGHTAEVTRVVFLPGGKQAVSSGCDATIRLWDLATGKEVRRFMGHRLSVRDIALSADGRRMISGGSDRALRLWDVGSGKELRRFEGHDGAVTAVALTPDGRRVLSASADGTVRLWEATTGKEVRRFKGHTQLVHGVAFSADGHRAVSGGDDRTVRLWDVNSGKLLRCWTGHEEGVTAVLFAPDGRRVLSASLDNTVRQWSLPK